jgi:Tfp pilus assembly protein PilV
MRCDGPANEQGFALIEAIVSLGVFALAAAAVGGLLISHIRMETSNATETMAISLATKEMEDLRALDYDSIPASRIGTTTVGALTYTVTSTATGDSPASGMTSIVTTVSWTDQLAARNYTINAIYTDVKR